MMLPKELLKDLETGNRTMDFVLEKKEPEPGPAMVFTDDDFAHPAMNAMRVRQMRLEAREMQIRESAERMRNAQRSFANFTNFNEF